MRLQIAPWKIIILIGLNISLAAIAGSAFLSDDAHLPTRLDWPTQAAPSNKALPDAKPITSYPQTLARPVFFEIPRTIRPASTTSTYAASDRR